MKTILFQGDSITDADRNRENNASNGSGYATIVSAELGYKYPGKYSFFNRGVGGNRITDIIAREKSDIINLKPDIMSILIGVNDVWHEFDFNNGVSAEKYERYYELLLEDVLSELPNLKIMILEPFVLKGYATQEKWNLFRTEVEKRAMAARKIAHEFGVPFVELQNKYDSIYKTAPMDYWLRDGVHPTAAGHKIIADAWIETFEQNFNNL